MKSKIFTVAGLIMTAIFMMYFILAVNFTNALFPDKNSSYIALGVYVAAAALSFVIAGMLRICLLYTSRSSYLEASSDAFFSARRRSARSFHISASKQSGKLLQSGHANAAGAYLIHHKPEGRIQNIKYQYEQNKHHDACQTPEQS